MARTPFCSQVLFPVAFFFVSSRAKPRDPGSFSTPADAPPTTDQPRYVLLELRSGTLCHSERSEESRFLCCPGWPLRPPLPRPLCYGRGGLPQRGRQLRVLRSHHTRPHGHFLCLSSLCHSRAKRRIPAPELPRPTRGEAAARPRAAGEGPNLPRFQGAPHAFNARSQLRSENDKEIKFVSDERCACANRLIPESTLHKNAPILRDSILFWVFSSRTLCIR
jgi:hypothetical protein